MRIKTYAYTRPLAGLIAVSLIVPLFGCGRPNNQVNAAPPPPAQTSDYGTVPPPQQTTQHRGLTTGQKVAIIAGAAALYYMYKHHVNAQNQPTNVQYYRSKNGGIYYRDANHVAHFVTPPTQGFQVPADQAAQYEREAREQGFSDTAPSGSPSY